MGYLSSFSSFNVIIAVTRHFSGKKSYDLSGFFHNAQHGTNCILIPAFFQINRTAHDSIGAHKVFQLFIHILNGIRNLPAFYMVKFQDLIDFILSNNTVVIQRGKHLFPHNSTCHFYKGICESIVIALLSKFYLFIKPAQCFRLLFI